MLQKKFCWDLKVPWSGPRGDGTWEILLEARRKAGDVATLQAEMQTRAAPWPQEAHWQLQSPKERLETRLDLISVVPFCNFGNQVLCVLKATVRWCHLGLLLALPSRTQQHPLEPQWRLRRRLWRKHNIVDHTCSTPSETLLYHVRLSHEWHVSSNLWQGAKLIWLQPSQGHAQHVPENNSAIVQVSVRRSWELGCLWLCAPM